MSGCPLCKAPVDVQQEIELLREEVKVAALDAENWRLASRGSHATARAREEENAALRARLEKSEMKMRELESIAVEGQRIDLYDIRLVLARLRGES